jgi:hypothetical protein
MPPDSSERIDTSKFVLQQTISNGAPTVLVSYSYTLLKICPGQVPGTRSLSMPCSRDNRPSRSQQAGKRTCLIKRYDTVLPFFSRTAVTDSLRIGGQQYVCAIISAARLRDKSRKLKKGMKRRQQTRALRLIQFIPPTRGSWSIKYARKCTIFSR